MTYEELKILLDISDPVEVLESAGRKHNKDWFVVCDGGDCHAFDKHGKELDIKQAKIKAFNPYMVSKDIKKIVVPDGVKRIGDHAFYSYESLKSVELPISVICIGDHAFTQCRSLKRIDIPPNVKVIYENAFEHCSSLESIALPDGMWTIKHCAFYKCVSLKRIEVPESICHVGEYTFYKCTSLEKVVFKGKTMEQVRAMAGYPWGIEDESIIKCA